MRGVLLIAVFAAGTASAQVRGFVSFGVGGGPMPVAPAPSTGAWTGYVGGWRDTSPPAGTWTGYVGGWQGTRGPGLVRAPVYRPMPYVVGPTWFPTTTRDDEAEKQAAAQRAWAEAEAAREREASERRVAEERQRAAEERERAALERERAAEERARAAEQQRLADQALEAQRALIAQQQAELQRLAAASPPPPPPAAAPRDETPGNEVYRWTDEDGVTHYSTRVPPEAVGKAKPVGGKSKR